MNWDGWVFLAFFWIPHTLIGLNCSESNVLARGPHPPSAALVSAPSVGGCYNVYLPCNKNSDFCDPAPVAWDWVLGSSMVLPYISFQVSCTRFLVANSPDSHLPMEAGMLTGILVRPSGFYK